MKKNNTAFTYFDFAATTPVDSDVVQAMEQYLNIHFANPSSVHIAGQQARYAIDQSRQTLADFLGCTSENIFFTSGATESNNIALQGSVESGQHIITTQIEHPAVREVCQHLEQKGIEVTYLPVDKNGIVSVVDIRRSVKKNTRLVSVMYINNEVGSIQPIEAIGSALVEINKDRELPIMFHIDAVQAVNYFSCDISITHADFVSLSAHKCYGPKGVGVLYVKNIKSLKPLYYGGAQEQTLRPGTIPTSQVVGFASAIQKIGDTKELSRVRTLKQQLLDELVGVEKISLTIKPEYQSPAICHILLKGVSTQTAMIKLDQLGLIISGGAACAAGSPQASYVLDALKKNTTDCATLRISIGRYTTAHEVSQLTHALKEL